MWLQLLMSNQIWDTIAHSMKRYDVLSPSSAGTTERNTDWTTPASEADRRSKSCFVT
jgi:hypothetical protein